MEDSDRRQEIVDALDDLSGALEEFDNAVEAHEVGGKLAVALCRTKAALVRRQCELSELPDGSKEVFLNQAKEFEEQADKLERTLNVSHTETIGGRSQEESGDDSEIKGGFEEHVRVKLKEHDECIQGLIGNWDTQASTNEHTLEILKELATRMEVLEQSI